MVEAILFLRGRGDAAGRGTETVASTSRIKAGNVHFSPGRPCNVVYFPCGKSPPPTT